MNTLTYKGYTSRIDIDDRDNIIVGRILGIRDIISFHGETVSEARIEFEKAVDDYLDDCIAHGIPPEKPASGHIMLRVPPELHTKALTASQCHDFKSLNQFCIEAIKHFIAYCQNNTDNDQSH